MAYTPIVIDRNALTIMGVSFPNRATLEDAASAIGSNMFEGFVPTQGIVELFRDYIEGKISRAAIPALIKEQLE
jgi:putative transcriptional regulator